MLVYIICNILVSHKDLKHNSFPKVPYKIQSTPIFYFEFKVRLSFELSSSITKYRRETNIILELSVWDKKDISVCVSISQKQNL